MAINQAELINRNLALSEENARLRDIINQLRNLEKSSLDDAHLHTPRDGVQTTTSSSVGSTHSPSAAGHSSPNTTGGVNNTTSVGGGHTATPVGDAYSHPVSKANRTSQTETERGPKSLAKKPQTQGKKSSKERVEITPSYIPNQAPNPRTKVLLDRSGPVGTRQGFVSPATKPAGDRPQRLSSTKWWRPLSFSVTLEGSGQTEEILTS